jgi:RNA polymerase sigma-70 factor (ECF subfamily)
LERQPKKLEKIPRAMGAMSSLLQMIDSLLSPIAFPGPGWNECLPQSFGYGKRGHFMNSDEQFEAVVSEFYEPLFRFAMSLTRAESDAQDLTQQTFYVWATKGHQLRDDSKAKTWLYTTLHRIFLNSRRRQTRFPHHDLEEVSGELPFVSPNFANQLDSTQMLVALAKVDEVYQAAVALFYLDDLSYKEIAAILEVQIGTVKSRISRGIAQLREILMSTGSGGPAHSLGQNLPPADAVEPVAPAQGSVPHSAALAD